MSSSLLSTYLPSYFAEHHLAEAGFDGGIHRQHPECFASERLAFYRILFSHHDGIRVRVCDIGWAIAVMIGERVSDEIEAEALQMAEEAAGIADAGYRMHPPTAKKISTDAMLLVEQVVEF